MIKICDKCNHTMAYDSYFDAVICRYCGNRIDMMNGMKDINEIEEKKVAEVFTKKLKESVI
jgi:uncharacterized CHY-type Zn-finger protein